MQLEPITEQQAELRFRGVPFARRHLPCFGHLLQLRPDELHSRFLARKVFQAEVPDRVLGSRAVYEKQVDAAGRTVQYTKTTYDPAGSIPHVKDKITCLPSCRGFLRRRIARPPRKRLGRG